MGFRRRGFGRDQTAVNQSIGFLIGGIVLVAGFGVAIGESARQGEPATVDNGDALATRADSLIDQLISTPGSGWYGAERCGDGQAPGTMKTDESFDADKVDRVGLSSEETCGGGQGGQGNLSYKKILNLNRASYGGNGSNTYLDYEEARRTLGLEKEGRDFHIRSQPLLPSMTEILVSAEPDQHLRPLYVGAFAKNTTVLDAPTGLVHEVGTDESSKYVTLFAEILNTGATATTFETRFTVPLQERDLVITRHTPVLAPGESYNATARLWKSSDWQWANQASTEGSIRVCAVLLNQFGETIDGTGFDGLNFTIYSVRAPPQSGLVAAGAFPPTTFTAPFTLNADVVGPDGILDAICQVYDGLPLGGYFYGQSTVPGAIGWAAPMYSDMHKNPVQDFDDFLGYSGQLFDDDTNNDDDRNTDSDGHIVLNSNRPQRTLLVKFDFVGGLGGYTGPSEPDVAYPRMVTYTISDVDGTQAEGGIDFAEIDMSSEDRRKQVLVQATQPTFELDGGAVGAGLQYEAFKGDGQPTRFKDWTMTITNEAGLDVYGPDALPRTKTGTVHFTTALPGSYEARLNNDNLNKLWNLDVVNVVDEPVLPFDPELEVPVYVPRLSAVVEAQFLAQMAARFDPAVFDAEFAHASLPSAPGGDVIPDVKHVLNTLLPEMLAPGGTPTLGRYNLLVIGSDVDHSVITSVAARQSIRAWVEAGGMLVVLGSEDQTIDWMSPLLSTGIHSASGGLETPDLHHPLLKSPNDLDVESFDLHGGVWSFGSAEDAQRFTHVLRKGDGDLVAVSNHGAFGKGKVLLISFRPFDLLAGEEFGCELDALTAQCQGLLVMHNLINQAYGTLYVDYGPPLTDEQSQESATRLATIWHPTLERHVVLKLRIHVF